MIEVLCIVVGAVIGFITGALVYRNNADEWQVKAQEVEDKFDKSTAEAAKIITQLRAELEAATKPKTRKKK